MVRLCFVSLQFARLQQISYHLALLGLQEVP